jgi:hypothetical protein
MTQDMRELKCRAAREVIDALGGPEPVQVLHVGGLALDKLRLWGTDFSDDLHLLVQDDRLGDFMDAMERGGYALAGYNHHAGHCVPLNRQAVENDIARMPASPEAAHVHKDYVGPPPGSQRKMGQPDLWIRFHTTTRHGALLLSDLGGWFAEAQTVRVMEGTNYATDVERPPLWALLLWQAAEVTGAAGEWGVTRDDVDALYTIARQADCDWDKVRANVKQYDHEYSRRMGLDVVKDLMKRYKRLLDIDDSVLRQAEHEYGPRYELGHALKALKDYGGDYAASVDEETWTAVEGVTTERPRKIWAYPDVVHGHSIPPSGSRGGRLGVAQPGFGIYEQIQEHGGTDFDYLIRRGLVKLLIPAPGQSRDAPPHGPWHDCKKTDMDKIFPP